MNDIVKRLRKVSLNLKKMRFITISDQIDKDTDEIEKMFDREIPKKIIRTVNGEPFVPRGYGKCPKCKTTVTFRDKYCRECGQRLG